MLDNIIGVVLAGGLSTRMGQDKAQLVYKNQTLITHMQDLLIQVGIKQVCISHPNFISDVLPRCGPLGGIYAVIDSIDLKSYQLCIVPVDMPNLTPALLTTLINHMVGNAIQACYYAGNILPLVLSVTPELKLKILQIINSQTIASSIKNLLATVEVGMVNYNKQDLLLFDNINTPQQWLDHVGSV